MAESLQKLWLIRGGEHLSKQDPVWFLSRVFHKLGKLCANYTIQQSKHHDSCTYLLRQGSYRLYVAPAKAASLQNSQNNEGFCSWANLHLARSLEDLKVARE